MLSKNRKSFLKNQMSYNKPGKWFKTMTKKVGIMN